VRNHYRRTPFLLAGLALSSTALVVAAPPASAALIEGRVLAKTYVDTDDGCDEVGDPDSELGVFTNRTGSRTVRADGDFAAADAGTHEAGASGQSDLETTAYGTVRDRAFKRVDLESTQVVQLTNDSTVDCHLAVVALSNADAVVRVRERGRIKVRWNSSGGDLELVSLTGPSGTLFRRDPGPGSGEVVVRVRPGTYQLVSQLRTTIREIDVPVTQADTLVGYFTSSATFLS
jgi:hypothetical protein